MDAIEELAQLADSMRQAAGLLNDDDIDDNSSTKRPSTFLNVIALGNTEPIRPWFKFRQEQWCEFSAERKL
ncbi:hypothetical protein Tco_1575707 [Tanacetum coccineum]